MRAVFVRRLEPQGCAKPPKTPFKPTPRLLWDFPYFAPLDTWDHSLHTPGQDVPLAVAVQPPRSHVAQIKRRGTATRCQWLSPCIEESLPVDLLSATASKSLREQRYHYGGMVQKGSRVAAIYDIHGNLPALEAVLADLESVRPDLIVVGGDVVTGPMPAEVLDRLAALSESICFVRGNADREVVAAYDAGADCAERVAAYAASKINRKHRNLLASFDERLLIEVEGVGYVWFCHGSPRSDEEIVTTATTEERFREILAGVDQDFVVCGHTRPVRSARRSYKDGQRWQYRDALPGEAGWSLLAVARGRRSLISA